MISLALTAPGSAALADSKPQSVDYFLISRGDDGLFQGSHKIFQREAEGMKQVKYCGRSYWVRPVTVAWTQIEMENSREVRVEFNRGKGWRPICERPTDYVTLADLGVDMDPRVMIYTRGEGFSLANRFNAVSAAFRTGKQKDRTSSSFHGE